LALRAGLWCRTLPSRRKAGGVPGGNSDPPKLAKKGKISKVLFFLKRGPPTSFHFCFVSESRLARSPFGTEGNSGGFFLPLHLHACWTPWSVLQDGTIETMPLTGDLPTSFFFLSPSSVRPFPPFSERQAFLGTFCSRRPVK